jgi:hypothetical protein
MSDAVVAAGGLPAALQARKCHLLIQAIMECTHKVHTEQAGAYSIMASAKFLQGHIYHVRAVQAC